MNDHHSMGRFLVATSLISFAMNWLWEMIEMPGYAEMAGKTWGTTATACTIATLGDLTMTLSIFVIVALAAGSPRWAMEWRWNCFAAAAILGALFAAGYEWHILAFGPWSYSPAMPIVPGLGVGLWPFLQLPLLIPASLGLGALTIRRVRSA